MEKPDVFMSIVFGLLSGIWVGLIQTSFTTLLSERPALRIGLLVIFPSLAWFIMTFGILAFAKTAIPDWIGMNALLTGLAVLGLSVVGILLKKIIPGLNKAIPFSISITFLGVCFNVIFLFLRM